MDTPEKLQALRDDFDQLVVEGQMGGDWYDRTRRGVVDMAGTDPDQQRLTSSTLAQYSAQADPGTNLNFSLNALNQEALGARTGLIRTGPMDNRFFKSVAETGEASLGPKTGIYRGQFDPTMEGQTTAVNDIWHARAWGYVETDGTPWSSGMSPQQHAWLDAETVLAGERANRRQLAGKTDWDSRSVQAAPWVAAKGADLHKRFPKRFPTLEDGLAEAAKSYPDHFDTRTVSLTQPQGARKFDDPETGRDLITGAAGLHTLPRRGGVGRVLMPNEEDALGQTRRAQDVDALRASELLRSTLTGQEATFSQAIPKGRAKAKGATDIALKATTPGPLKPRQHSRLEDLFEGEGLQEILDTGQGATLQFEDVRTPAQMRKLLQSKEAGINFIRPGTVSQARTVGETPARGLLDEPGSGRVTEATLRAFDEATIPRMAERVSGNEPLRRRAQQLFDQQSQPGVNARPDVLNALSAFAQGGLLGLQQALQKGLPLPAALLVLEELERQ